MSEVYATVNDIISLARPLTPEETTRAEALLPVVSDSLRQEAVNRGRDLDAMIASGRVNMNTVTMVTVDIVLRTLNTATRQEPMSQFSESALGYTQSGTYLIPGGGLFIKNSELKRLGLLNQRFGFIDLYDHGKGPCCND